MDSVHSLVRIWFSEKGGGPLWEKDELLPQVEEFKYFGVLFMTEGRGERKINKQIGAVAAASIKVKVYRSIYNPTLTYSPERTRLWRQTVEMSFLQRLAGIR